MAKKEEEGRSRSFKTVVKVPEAHITAFCGLCGRFQREGFTNGCQALSGVFSGEKNGLDRASEEQARIANRGKCIFAALRGLVADLEGDTFFLHPRLPKVGSDQDPIKNLTPRHFPEFGT